MFQYIDNTYMFNNYRTHETIKECMDTELPEIKKLYKENKLQSIQQKEAVGNENK